MPDPKMRLAFREPDIDTNMPFVDGSVKVDRIEDAQKVRALMSSVDPGPAQ